MNTVLQAIAYVRDLAAQTAPLTEFDIQTLHSLVMKRSQPEHGGRYADRGRFVFTDSGRQALPSPAEIPALMNAFAA